MSWTTTWSTYRGRAVAILDDTDVVRGEVTNATLSPPTLTLTLPNETVLEVHPKYIWPLLTNYDDCVDLHLRSV